MNHKFFQNKKCEYFPCHLISKDMKKRFSCLMCYCPLYTYKDCGGKYSVTDNGIKDCSNCLLPHYNYDYIVNKLKKINKEEF